LSLPTRLPAPSPFRPLALHATRRDRITVGALLLVCALLTLGVASATHTADFDLMADGGA
jgi:hypothetical protein